MGRSKRREAFDRLCIETLGRVLTGKSAHACPDWDGQLIDETCPEWPCACTTTMGPKRGFGDAAGEVE